ncbi:MAG: hypothetical protein ACTHVM_04435 [Alkalibacterium gilvum]|uniref:Uncharacterized protein n=1 Tax=Alkalibacterium gilvum TaxID=1130080 RepID=A0A1H6V2B2_9LACT|nr:MULTISPECIES: hypothetical protein [Alkalibacterium]MDN6194596.1 hypothetical protein [Alkalibacterium sp.]MDN6293390.1 hypothetical protein [Alkalibacterium sp.]MDN6295337.1 hypothetical protein [Alkalibacterium sp.]SEI98651.1 hypothetical protein SAMN04488113_1432 [Alkalibacterium gilvum]HAJ69660.1 hypothetical protein [Alkalibacterium sp.]
MHLEERISHINYALDRRESILRSQIDGRFPVSFTAVSRRVRVVNDFRHELQQIANTSDGDDSGALKKLDAIEYNLFGRF